ncbi:hypothetical protein H257_05757 [Aphanomyces astaci]|uniref:Tc1-like transposase DDE domain-containing protein n=1 Tax=Aphanomyces astaci TaxID=112090 RepID=W4GNA1_APHAT|nr:hypothetical protein H257_05757 [Aphanomyces astaci]ETV81170.1 hypothetical protein H257_05757 [Aphanomyces astaci]|eukprot:XP_009829028.1 hypothetical protein H257_05757 [Aphanomyces astaci]
MPSTTAISDDDYDEIASYIRQERPRSLTKEERLDILRLHAELRRDGQMQVSSTIGRLLGRSQKDVMALLLEAKIIHYDVNCKPEAVNCLRRVQQFLVKLGFKRGKRRGHAAYAMSSAHATARDVYVQHMMQLAPATPVVYLDESYIHHHYARHHDSLYDPTDNGPTKEMHKGRRFCFIAGIMAASPTESVVVGLDHSAFIQSTTTISSIKTAAHEAVLALLRGPPILAATFIEETCNLNDLPRTSSETLALPEMSFHWLVESLRAHDIATMAMITVEGEMDLFSTSTVDDSVPAAPLKSQTWGSLRSNPYYDLFKELRTSSPTKCPPTTCRQGFPTRDRPLDAIDAFFAARKVAGHVRDSISPHNSPTLCVKKPGGK